MQENCHMMSCVAGGYVGLKSEQQKRHFANGFTTVFSPLYRLLACPTETPAIRAMTYPTWPKNVLHDIL